jgi:hypothetical protein
MPNIGDRPTRRLTRVTAVKIRRMERRVLDIAEKKTSMLPSGNPDSPESSDRRAAPRLPCEGTAEVSVLGGALRFTGRVRNLSATGCCLSTDVVFILERGTQVEVVMVVGGVSFRVAGGVRSNHKVRGVGLEFMTVSSRCARLIQELIGDLEAKARRETS